MTRYLLAHDMDADDGKRWFVIDTRKAEAACPSWAEANEIRKRLEETTKAVQEDDR